MTQSLFDWVSESLFPNEIIRASAGTGKTFQLSNRYLALAKVCDRPDEILAATFARKAAGEILDRVVLRLAEAATDEQKLAQLAEIIIEQKAAASFDESDSRALLAKLIRNLHRLRISTLDSFFAQIAGSFGLELGLPPGWVIVDEVTDQRLRSLAIQDVLADGRVSELLTLLHLLNKGDVTRAVSEQIRQTANELYTLYRETTPNPSQGEIPAVWKSIPRYKQLTEEEWEDTILSLELLELPDKKVLHNARARDYELACAEDWEKLVDGGLVKAILEGKSTFNRAEIPPAAQEVYAPILEHLKAKLINRLADQTDATWKLLDRFHGAYQRLKADQRAYRFEDVTQLLANAITEMNSDQMAFRLDVHVSHLLLDEFQDTSLLQWTVLRPFAEQAASDPERSFFCVGDVKQAIYGWRGGVAELFDSLGEQITPLAERNLTRSFRSSQIVIDTVNSVFDRLSSNAVMEKLSGVAEVWQDRFQTHSTARDLPGYCEMQTAPRASDDESQAVETLRFAAAEVARLHREMPGASIGILVRKNQAVARMIYELRHQHGVEASEEGGNPLLDSAAVQLLLSLLAIADHPGDTIARFHVAHSPLGAIVGLTDYADDRAARRLSWEVRHSLLERGYGPTLYNWVRELSPFCDERELTRLMQLVGLAYRYEDQATEQAEDFINVVSGTKVEDPSAALVRVMNVHQSKGLQFDVVVLPELDGRIGGMTPAVVVGRPAPTAPIDVVCRYVPGKLLPLLPPRFAEMFEQHSRQNDNEATCLLYVAMTRAIHALHLIVAPSKENERSLPKSYAGLLRAALVEGEAALPPGETVYHHGEEDWFQQHAAEKIPGPPEAEDVRLRLVPRPPQRKRRLERQIPSELEGGRLIELGQRFPEDSVLVRTRGALWHKWLEHVNWQDRTPAEGPPHDDVLRQVAGQFLHPRLNLTAEIAKFRESLQQPVVHQALSRGPYHDGNVVGFAEGLAIESEELEVHHQFPFAVRNNHVLTQGIMDRLVLLKRGNQVVAADVIDFKTDGFSPGDRSTVNRLGEYYRPQLAAYHAAVRQVFSLSSAVVHARLLFLEPGVEWRLS